MAVLRPAKACRAVLHPLLLAGRESVLALLLASVQRTTEAVGVVDTLDTVCGVDVLDQRDLVASGGTLAGDNGAVSKEELPDLRITMLANHTTFTYLSTQNSL